MDGSYAKVFRTMFTGSMYGAGLHVFAVWSWILANKDEDGLLEIQPRRVADELGGTVDQVLEAVEYLMRPDPESRSKDEEGRRIVSVGAFTYRVVNHDFYRSKGMTPVRSIDNDPTKIYFIRLGGAVKIGRSTNPWARLNALKTAMPETPELLGYFCGVPADERRLQEKWGHLKLNREWFRLTHELAAEIDRLVNSTVATTYLASTTMVASAVATMNYNNTDTDTDADKTTTDVVVSSRVREGRRDNDDVAASPFVSTVGSDIASEADRVIELWNRFAKQPVRGAEFTQVQRQYSTLRLAVPPNMLSYDEIVGAVENYRLACGLPASQAPKLSLGRFLDPTIIKKYLPGMFTLDHYDKTQFERGPSDGSHRCAKGHLGACSGPGVHKHAGEYGDYWLCEAHEPRKAVPA